MRALINRLNRDEQGIALVMALGILTVLAIMIVTVIDYTATNQRTAYYSRAKVTAFDAATNRVTSASSTTPRIAITVRSSTSE